MRWVGAVLAVAVLALAACGDDSSGAGGAPDTSSPAEALTIRLVLRDEPPPCDSVTREPDELVVAGLGDDGNATCLVLGPAIVDGTAISESHLVSSPGDSEAMVAAQLDAAGSARFDQLASGHVGERAAVTLGDQLLSAPMLSADHSEGTIAIGPLTHDDAVALLSALHGGTAPDRASQLCAAHGLTIGAESTVTIIQETTAGEINRSMGADAVEPWKSLPDDHFVAVCGYALLRGTPTSDCSDETPSPLLATFLVDEDGSAMPDPRVDGPGIVFCL